MPSSCAQRVIHEIYNLPGSQQQVMYYRPSWLKANKSCLIVHNFPFPPGMPPEPAVACPAKTKIVDVDKSSLAPTARFQGTPVPAALPPDPAALLHLAQAVT